MQLTLRAAGMTEQLRSLLVASDGLCAPTPAFDPRTSARAFRLLVTDVGTIVFLPALLSRVAREGGNLMIFGRMPFAEYTSGISHLAHVEIRNFVGGEHQRPKSFKCLPMQ